MNRIQEQQRALLDAIESMDRGEGAVAVVSETNYEGAVAVVSETNYEGAVAVVSETNYSMVVELVRQIVESIPMIAERRRRPVLSPAAPTMRYSFVRLLRQPLSLPRIPQSLLGLPIPDENLI